MSLRTPCGGCGWADLGDPVGHRAHQRSCDALDHAARSGRCKCGAPLDATVHHDDTSDGRTTCADCCPTCNTEENPT